MSAPHQARPLHLVTPAIPLGLLAIELGNEELRVVKIALVIAFLIMSLALHEVAHGWVALQRGDTTARDLGRITLNPLAHVDPIMTVILPAFLYWRFGFVFGGARPVPVNPNNLRHPLRDMVLVAIAGPGTNLILAVVFMLVYKVSVTFGAYPGAAATPGMRQQDLLPQVMQDCMWFNVLLAVFNMLPIPPLDGSRVMTWILPAPLRAPYVGLERLGMLVIFGLIFFFPPFQRFLLDSISQVAGFLDVMTGGIW